MALSELESLELEILQRERARRRNARKEAERIGRPEESERLAEIGFIRRRPGIVKRTKEAAIGTLPETGQIVGGLLGLLFGGKVGAPIRGQIFGGASGRTIGKVLQKGLRGEFEDLTDAEKKEAGKEILSTAASTAVIETATAGAGKLISGLGKGALEGLLGPRVAQRGSEKGFRKLLDPKFFQGRIPKTIAFKTSQFFNKLDNVTGKSVERAVRSKSAKGAKIKFGPIRDLANKALKDQGADFIEEIFPVGTSISQIKKVKLAKNLIDRVKQDDISLLSLWKIRRGLDKIRFGSSFSDDVTRYLDTLRNGLNAPLTRIPSVKRAFGRYSSVKALEKDLGNKFRSTLIDDEIFTPQTEQFANNLLGTSKDETIRSLKALDGFLGAEDKVIEDLLDVAATESLEKPLQNIGTIQRSITEGLGGRRAIAGAAATLQTPQVQVLKVLTSGGLPTAITTGLETGLEGE